MSIVDLKSFFDSIDSTNRAKEARNRGRNVRAVGLHAKQNIPIKLNFAFEEVNPPETKLDDKSNPAPRRSLKETLEILFKYYEDYVNAFNSVESIKDDSHLVELKKNLNENNPLTFQSVLFEILRKERDFFEKNLDLQSLNQLTQLYTDNVERCQTYVWTFQRHCKDVEACVVDKTKRKTDWSKSKFDIVEGQQQQQNQEQKDFYVTENEKHHEFNDAKKIKDFNYSDQSESGNEIVVLRDTFCKEITRSDDASATIALPNKIFDGPFTIVKISAPNFNNDDDDDDEGEKTEFGSAEEFIKVQKRRIDNVVKRLDEYLKLSKQFQLTIDEPNNSHTGKWRLYRVGNGFRYDGSQKLSKSGFDLVLDIDLVVSGVKERYSYMEGFNALLHANPFSEFGFDQQSYLFLKRSIDSPIVSSTIVQHLNRRIEQYRMYVHNRSVKTHLDSLDNESKIIPEGPQSFPKPKRNSRIPYVLDPNLLSETQSRCILQYAMFLQTITKNSYSKGFKYDDSLLEDSREIVAKHFSDALVFLESNSKRLVSRRFEDYKQFVQHMKSTGLDIPDEADFGSIFVQNSLLSEFSDDIEELKRKTLLKLEESQVNDKQKVKDQFIKDFTDQLKQDIRQLSQTVRFTLEQENLFEQDIQQSTDEFQQKIEEGFDARIKQTKKEVGDRNFETQPQHPYYLLLELFKLEYNVKYLNTSQRTLDYIYSSAEPKVNRAFRLSKRANLLNSFLLRDGRAELMDLATITYNDRICEINPQHRSKIDLSDMNMHFSELIETMLEFYGKESKSNAKWIENDDFRYETFECKNMLLLCNLKLFSDSATYEIYQTIDPKFLFQVSTCLFMRAEIALDVYQREFANIEDYDAKKHDPLLLTINPKIRNLQVSLHSRPSFRSALRLPRFVLNMRNGDTLPRSDKIQWYFLPLKNFAWLDGIVNLFYDYRNLLNDRRRYCGCNPTFENLWLKTKYNSQRLDSLPMANENLVLTLGKANLDQLQSNVDIAFNNLLSDQTNKENLAEFQRAQEAFSNATHNTNSLLNGLYFCIEIDNENNTDYSNVVGVFDINIDLAYQKFMFCESLSETITIEDLYWRSANINVLPIESLQWIKYKKDGNGQQILRIVDRPSAMSNRKFIEQQGFLFFSQPNRHDAALYICRLVFEQTQEIVDFLFDIEIDENECCDDSGYQSVCKRCLSEIEGENAKSCVWTPKLRRSSRNIDVCKFLESKIGFQTLNNTPLFELTKIVQKNQKLVQIDRMHVQDVLKLLSGRFETIILLMRLLRVKKKSIERFVCDEMTLYELKKYIAQYNLNFKVHEATWGTSGALFEPILDASRPLVHEATLDASRPWEKNDEILNLLSVETLQDLCNSFDSHQEFTGLHNCRDWKPDLFDTFSTLKQSNVEQANRIVLRKSADDKFVVRSHAGLLYANNYSIRPSSILFTSLHRYTPIQEGSMLSNEHRFFKETRQKWRDVFETKIVPHNIQDIYTILAREYELNARFGAKLQFPWTKFIDYLQVTRGDNIEALDKDKSQLLRSTMFAEQLKGNVVYLYHLTMMVNCYMSLKQTSTLLDSEESDLIHDIKLVVAYLYHHYIPSSKFILQTNRFKNLKVPLSLMLQNSTVPNHDIPVLDTLYSFDLPSISVWDLSDNDFCGKTLEDRTPISDTSDKCTLISEQMQYKLLKIAKFVFSVYNRGDDSYKVVYTESLITKLIENKTLSLDEIEELQDDIEELERDMNTLTDFQEKFSQANLKIQQQRQLFNAKKRQIETELKEEINTNWLDPIDSFRTLFQQQQADFDANHSVFSQRRDQLEQEISQTKQEIVIFQKNRDIGGIDALNRRISQTNRAIAEHLRNTENVILNQGKSIIDIDLANVLNSQKQLFQAFIQQRSQFLNNIDRQIDVLEVDNFNEFANLAFYKQMVQDYAKQNENQNDHLKYFMAKLRDLDRPNSLLRNLIALRLPLNDSDDNRFDSISPNRLSRDDLARQFAQNWQEFRSDLQDEIRDNFRNLKAQAILQRNVTRLGQTAFRNFVAEIERDFTGLETNISTVLQNNAASLEIINQAIQQYSGDNNGNLKLSQQETTNIDNKIKDIENSITKMEKKVQNRENIRKNLAINLKVNDGEKEFEAFTKQVDVVRKALSEQNQQRIKAKLPDPVEIRFENSVPQIVRLLVEEVQRSRLKFQIETKLLSGFKRRRDSAYRNLRKLRTEYNKIVDNLCEIAQKRAAENLAEQEKLAGEKLLQSFLLKKEKYTELLTQIRRQNTDEDDDNDDGDELFGRAIGEDEKIDIDDIDEQEKFITDLDLKYGGNQIRLLSKEEIEVEIEKDVNSLESGTRDIFIRSLQRSYDVFDEDERQNNVYCNYFDIINRELIYFSKNIEKSVYFFNQKPQFDLQSLMKLISDSKRNGIRFEDTLLSEEDRQDILSCVSIRKTKIIIAKLIIEALKTKFGDNNRPQPNIVEQDLKLLIANIESEWQNLLDFFLDDTRKISKEIVAIEKNAVVNSIKQTNQLLDRKIKTFNETMKRVQLEKIREIDDKSKFKSDAVDSLRLAEARRFTINTNPVVFKNQQMIVNLIAQSVSEEAEDLDLSFLKTKVNAQSISDDNDDTKLKNIVQRYDFQPIDRPEGRTTDAKGDSGEVFNQSLGTNRFMTDASLHLYSSLYHLKNEFFDIRKLIVGDDDLKRSVFQNIANVFVVPKNANVEFELRNTEIFRHIKILLHCQIQAILAQKIVERFGQRKNVIQLNDDSALYEFDEFFKIYDIDLQTSGIDASGRDFFRNFIIEPRVFLEKRSNDINFMVEKMFLFGKNLETINEIMGGVFDGTKLIHLRKRKIKEYNDRLENLSLLFLKTYERRLDELRCGLSILYNIVFMNRYYFSFLKQGKTKLYNENSTNVYTFLVTMPEQSLFTCLFHYFRKKEFKTLFEDNLSDSRYNSLFLFDSLAMQFVLIDRQAKYNLYNLLNFPNTLTIRDSGSFPVVENFISDYIDRTDSLVIKTFLTDDNDSEPGIQDELWIKTTANNKKIWTKLTQDLRDRISVDRIVLPETFYVEKKLVYQLALREKLYQVDNDVPLHHSINQRFVEHEKQVLRDFIEGRKSRFNDLKRRFDDEIVLSEKFIKSQNLLQRFVTSEFQLSQETSLSGPTLDKKRLEFEVFTSEIYFPILAKEDFPLKEFYYILDYVIEDNQSFKTDFTRKLIDNSMFRRDFDTMPIRSRISDVVETIEGYLKDVAFVQTITDDATILTAIDLREKIQSIADFDASNIFRVGFSNSFTMIETMARKLQLLNIAEQEYSRALIVDQFSLIEFLKQMFQSFVPFLDKKEPKVLEESVEPLIRFLRLRKDVENTTFNDIVDFLRNLRDSDFVKSNYSKNVVVEGSDEYELDTSVNPLFANLDLTIAEKDQLIVILGETILFYLAKNTMARENYAVENRLKGPLFSFLGDDKDNDGDIDVIGTGGSSIGSQKSIFDEVANEDSSHLNSFGLQFYNNRRKFIEFSNKLLKNDNNNNNNNTNNSVLFEDNITDPGDTNRNVNLKFQPNVKKTSDIGSSLKDSALFTLEKFTEKYSKIIDVINDLEGEIAPFTQNLLILMGKQWFHSDFLFLDYSDEQKFKDLKLDPRFDFKENQRLFKLWFEKINNAQEFVYVPKVFVDKQTEIPSKSDDNIMLKTRFLFGKIQEDLELPLPKVLIKFNQNMEFLDRLDD